MIDPEDRAFIYLNVPLDLLRGRRILVTGGSGFIGHWLSVVPSWVTIRALNREQYEFGKWDYAHWDHIIHLANVPPTRVIQCASRCNASILFSSSGAVYDAEPGEYAMEKLSAETELLESGLDVKIARMFSFAGGHMRNHFAVINMIYDALSGGPIRIRGDNVTRSYLYAADMAVWLWRILLRGSSRGIYEVGSGYGVTMQQLANEISCNFRPEIPVIYDRMFGPDPRPHYVPHDRELYRTQSDLGLEQWTRFPDVIRNTIQFYKIELEGGL